MIVCAGAQFSGNPGTTEGAGGKRLKSREHHSQPNVQVCEQYRSNRITTKHSRQATATDCAFSDAKHTPANRHVEQFERSVLIVLLNSSSLCQPHRPVRFVPCTKGTVYIRCGCAVVRRQPKSPAFRKHSDMPPIARPCRALGCRSCFASFLPLIHFQSEAKFGDASQFQAIFSRWKIKNPF